MRIKFNDGDPRAGTVAEMDSSRGQQLIDEGSAVQVKDSEEPEAEQVEAVKTIKSAPKSKGRAK